MLVSADSENAPSPMLMTLAGMVILVSADSENAPALMLVTPAGITTEPAHEPPLVTTPLVIVKFGVELERNPVVQR
jgi:hypothetical protein